MANNNSSPFPNLWQLGAYHSLLNLHLVVIADDALYQDNLWKLEADANKTVPRCLPIPFGRKAHMVMVSFFLEVLCRFEIVDDLPLAS